MDESSPRPARRRPLSVRARTTLAATATVGAGVVVLAVSLLVLLHRSLVQQLDQVSRVRAEEIAAQARSGILAPALPDGGDDDALAQVVDGAGRVVAATPGIDRRAPLVEVRPGPDRPVRRTVRLAWDGEAGEYRVYALHADGPTGPLSVYVASTTDPLNDATGFVRRALAVGAPVLLALVAATAWAGTGRALRPVEVIRARVADISATSLHRRVPVPRTRDEISRLAATMNSMLDRLEAAAVRQRRFVADASHELQTPLASVRTDLEVAARHPGQADWTSTAADVLAANRRMERLVSDLLFLARSDEGAPRPPPAPLDLDDIVLAEAAEVRAAGGVTVDTASVSAAPVAGRRDDLRRAVRNLLDNAARHAASAISVELHGDEDRVVLVVADDGPGVPAGERERIFERFVRLDESRARAGGGTGLGLAITREIVAAHGGTVTVADTPGGARFEVRLPALSTPPSFTPRTRYRQGPNARSK